MDFRTALKNLNDAGEVNAKEFVDYLKRKGLMKTMPIKNASHCLSRLFKMRLAYRRKDKRHSNRKHRKKPYLYRISNQGIRYLKWLKTQEEKNGIELPKTITEQIMELDKKIFDLEKERYSNL